MPLDLAVPPRLSPSRSARIRKLSAEASNCIALAVSTADDPFTADLIDEACRLAVRARELRET